MYMYISINFIVMLAGTYRFQSLHKKVVVELYVKCSSTIVRRYTK